MDEWLEVPAENFCESVRDGTHDSPQPVEEGRYLITSRHIIGDRVDLSNAYRISEADFNEVTRRSEVHQWDVLITMIGTVGDVCLVREKPNFAIKNIGLFKSKGEIEGKWLYYYLKSPQTKALIESLKRGTTQAYIPLGELRRLPIRCPHNRGVVENIVFTLSSLDEKIELNRRMNETLEEVARALFKSWFVDFDPVRAKMEGRDPGLPKHLANLFPDRLVNSELGPMPEGWGCGSLGDVLHQRVERCRVSEETASRPYVPIDCISPRSLFLTESKPGTEAKSSLTKFYTFDLIFGAMRPYYHKVCIAPFEGTTRTTAFVLYPKRKYGFSFAAMLLHNPDTIDFATRNSTGSTIPYAVWTNSLEDMAITIPPPSVLEAFDDIVRPFLVRIPQRYFESRTLAALRDALLPKLISGELQVRGNKNVH